MVRGLANYFQNLVNYSPGSSYTMHQSVTDALVLFLISFDYISRESSTTRNVLWSRASVCLSVCLFVLGRIPTLLHEPECNLGGVSGNDPSCALLGGFAIGARVSLL